MAAVYLLGAKAATATVLWRGDFETGDLSQWDSSTLIKTGNRDNLALESDSVADGKKAAKITLRDDVIFEPYNQSRVEVKHVGLHTKNGEDSYFAWSFMVPKDAEIRSNIGYWESTPSFKNTMTFFIEPAQGGGTNLKFGTGDLGQTVRWTAKLTLNQWHRIAIHNHWSQSQADGKVDVWYDGMPVVSNVTATKLNADGLFLQMGLHRSDPSPPVQDIYIDAALEADVEADILQPLPDPMGTAGSGGTMSGGAGAGGSAGAAASAGGGRGASGISGASGAFSVAGEPAAGGGGADGMGNGGAITTAGGAALPSAGRASASPTATNEESPSCALRAPRRSHGNSWLMLGAALGWSARRRRFRP